MVWYARILSQGYGSNSMLKNMYQNVMLVIYSTVNFSMASFALNFQSTVRHVYAALKN